MAIREAIVTIPDTRDPIVGVDPSSGKLVQWDGEKWVEASADAIGYTAKQMETLEQKINNATTLVKALDEAQKKLEEGMLAKADLTNIQYLLDALKKGTTEIAGGIVLTNDIILSEPSDGRVTASISGSAVEGHKALRLGIKDSNNELTALRNDGTGHLGMLHFDGDRIVVAQEGDLAQAFMEFGRNVMRQTIQEVLSNNNSDTTNNLADYNVSAWQSAAKQFYVSNDGTIVTITMTIWTGGETVSSQQVATTIDPYAVAMLGDSQIGAVASKWIQSTMKPGAFYAQKKTADINISISLSKGYHTIKVAAGSAVAGATNVKVRKVYTTNYRQTSFSDRGMRIYGGPNSFVDFNHDHPAGTMFSMIRGGLDVDEIKLANGGFYAGGVINSFGSMTRWVGKKLIVAKISTGRYRITHNVGSDQYVIQAIPVNTDDWNAFVIKGSENTTSVEIGVMWNSGWRDGPIHFSIFAR